MGPDGVFACISQAYSGLLSDMTRDRQVVGSESSEARRRNGRRKRVENPEGGCSLNSGGGLRSQPGEMDGGEDRSASCWPQMPQVLREDSPLCSVTTDCGVWISSSEFLKTPKAPPHGPHGGH